MRRRSSTSGHGTRAILDAVIRMDALAWGELVEVLEPAEVRRTVGRRLREAARHYGEPGSGDDRD
jgi:predicted DNA-binding transcriptional regulator YafY